VTTAVYDGDITAALAIDTVMAMTYFVYSWSAYGRGQTIGMRSLKIRVTRTDGAYLDVVDAFIRGAALGVSITCLLIGVIWAAFDPQKQGWHDKIAHTYVSAV